MSSPLRHRLPRVLAVALLAASAVVRAAGPSLADSPIQTFRLALFDDTNGRKTSDLRGATAVYLGAELVEIRTFTLTLLDSNELVALKVTSPKAQLQTKNRIAEGDQGINVEGSGYSLAGQRWRCDEPSRKIAIRDEARVTFQAQLLDILQ